MCLRGYPGALLWSSAQLAEGTPSATPASTYTQTLGAHTWTLEHPSASEEDGVGNGTSLFSGRCDDVTVFTCTRGVRVVTTSGVPAAVVGVVGISPLPINITLTTTTRHPGVPKQHPDVSVVHGVVEPNCEYALDGHGGLALTRRVPFSLPASRK